MPHPIKAIFDIHRAEIPKILAMFFYFFLVITSFWILKPLKKTLFIGYYDEQGLDLLGWHLSAAGGELLAKILNMVVAYAAAVVFSALSRRYRRQQLTAIFSGAFMLGYLMYAQVLDRPGAATVWSFYLFGDLFSTLMVATFYAFLNDIVEPDTAKRTYGLIGLGGVAGGVFGSIFVATWINDLDTSTWMWVCFALASAIVGIARWVGRRARSVTLRPAPSPSTKPAPEVNPSSALAGVRLVLRSSYLVSVVVIVATYEIVSTLMDFQFSATIAHYASGPAIGEHFTEAFLITNVTAFTVQLLMTSYIMRRCGEVVALSVLPFTTLAASTVFFAFPILPVGKLLNAADNGFSYSINQSAKEALYVPTTTDEKYKAKAFIDMFVQRLAKGVAVMATLAITTIVADFSAVRWISVLTMVLCAGWMFAARYAGRRFEGAASAQPSVSRLLTPERAPTEHAG